MRAYFDRHGRYRGASVGGRGLVVLAIPFVLVAGVVFCWPLLVIQHGTTLRLVTEGAWLAILAGVTLWTRRTIRRAAARFRQLDTLTTRKGGRQ